MPDISDETAACHRHKLKAKESDFFETLIFLKIEENTPFRLQTASFHAFFSNEPGH